VEQWEHTHTHTHTHTHKPEHPGLAFPFPGESGIRRRRWNCFRVLHRRLGYRLVFIPVPVYLYRMMLPVGGTVCTCRYVCRKSYYGDVSLLSRRGSTWFYFIERGAAFSLPAAGLDFLHQVVVQLHVSTNALVYCTRRLLGGYGREDAGMCSKSGSKEVSSAFSCFFFCCCCCLLPPCAAALFRTPLCVIYPRSRSNAVTVNCNTFGTQRLSQPGGAGAEFSPKAIYLRTRVYFCVACYTPNARTNMTCDRSRLPCWLLQ
jgi:hypothetical protein